MVDERPLSAAVLFDAIGTGYEDAFGRPPVVDRAVQELLRRLPPGARVLDVGSGTGKPVAADLTAAGHAVTGLDVSSTMIEIARDEQPGPADRAIVNLSSIHATRTAVFPLHGLDPLP